MAKRQTLKPAFGSKGQLIGYLDDADAPQRVIAYDANFDLVGAAASAKSARNLLVVRAEAARPSASRVRLARTVFG